MDTVLLAARAVGVFYVIAAAVVMRAVVMDWVLDQALAAITLKPVPASERAGRWLMGAAALSFGMGGAALALLNLWAVPLFCAGAALLVAQRVWAGVADPPQDETASKGRRQATNALILYLAASALVAWLAWSGRLAPWGDPSALGIPAVGLMLLLLLGRIWTWRRQRQPYAAADMDDGAQTEEAPPPISRVRIEPTWGGFGFIDADTGEDRRPEAYIPDALAERFWRWKEVFHAAEDDSSRELFAVFDDDEHERRHRAEGDAIVAELETVFGAGNVEGPVYPKVIRRVG